MRRKSPKPKLQETVKIPARLGEFLRYANELIVEEDEAATIPSDDLIQIEESIGWLLASGGLNEEGGSQFSFTFFSEPKQTRKTWELKLNKEQIADIAAGRIEELTFWTCRMSDCGCKFMAPDGDCFYCDWEDIPSA
jgi:hypothetical protein